VKAQTKADGWFSRKNTSAFPTSHRHMESICDKGGRSVPIKGLFFPHTYDEGKQAIWLWVVVG